MREAVINIRAKHEDRDLIDQAAKVQGKNRSDFMMEAACEKAEEVLLDQVFFKLDDAAFKSFAAMIEAPFEPNKGFEKLMAAKAPWAYSAQ